MRLAERDRYPLAGPLTARRRGAGGGGDQRDPACPGLGDFGTSRARNGRICGASGASPFESRRGAVASPRDAISRKGCPNAVPPAGPQTSSRRGQPSGWLQMQRAGRAWQEPGGRPVFWKLRSDRRARWAGAAVGLVAACGLAPMAEPPIDAADWIRRGVRVPSSPRGLRGSSRRLCSPRGLAGAYPALISPNRSPVRSVRFYQAAASCFDARAQLNSAPTPKT